MPYNIRDIPELYAGCVIKAQRIVTSSTFPKLNDLFDSEIIEDVIKDWELLAWRRINTGDGTLTRNYYLVDETNLDEDEITIYDNILVVKELDTTIKIKKDTI